MNYTLGLGMPGMSEMLLLLGIILLLFGGTRLPQLAKGVGSSIREFKRGVAGMDEAAALGETSQTQRQAD